MIALATRGSALARAQAELAMAALRSKFPEAEFTAVVVDSDGDLSPATLAPDLPGQGWFTSRLERSLRTGQVEGAIHSAKDLPSATPEELELASVPDRRDPADALVGRSLAGLGPGATVATGSPRRRALLLERRPDIRVVELRGNMATRLGVAGRDGVDAVIAASAALERLGESGRVAERLEPSWFVPQVGQGALALEIRRDDLATRALVRSINDEDAMIAVTAERAFLAELGTGCSIPAGAHATVADGVITLNAVMVAIDGTRSVRSSREGVDAGALGTEMALFLRDHEGGASLPGW